MTSDTLTVWYNRLCPVCDTGVTRQKSRLIEAVKSGRIAFRDINFEPDALETYGAGIEDVRRRLHATRPDGSLLVGADVAVAVWRATPGQAWLAVLLGNPLVLPFSRFGYDRFADMLYWWNRWRKHW